MQQKLTKLAKDLKKTLELVKLQPFPSHSYSSVENAVQ